LGRSFRLAAVLLLLPLLAACGGSHASSPLVPLSTQSGAGAVPVLDGVPETGSNAAAVYVHLPLRNSTELDALVAAQSDKNSPQYHQFLSPSQFQDRYAPAIGDIKNAASSLQAMGFQTFTTTQGVVALGSQAQIQSAFGVSYRANAQSAVHAGAAAPLHAALAQGAVVLPQALRTLGASVVLPRHLFHLDSRHTASALDNRYSNIGPYWFTDLKQAYGYPSYQKLNGAGVTIAIVMSSDVSSADTTKYFAHEGLAAPRVTTRSIKGGSPFDPANNDASFEASLDVQQSLGSAPGARAILYSIPDLSDQSILLAYQRIVEKNDADVVSSSFGGCESDYLPAYNDGVDYTSDLTRTFHDIFSQGNAQGITWVASSGDFGATCINQYGNAVISVQAPADDPDVTGVGGTNLVTASTAGSLNSSYVSQNAYPDTLSLSPYVPWASGGGISAVFGKPWFQQLVTTRANARTVPDIAMHMGGCPNGVVVPCDPERSSVAAYVGGNGYLLIGTSAAAPEFAGLLAVTEQNLGARLGNANGYIYALAALDDDDTYRSGIPGNNGYPTRHGYDYVTGVGTPRAAAFALYQGPRAGNPGTPSNP
jgi:subtilase family serine protease